MPRIELKTVIKAHISLVFDLSRSIDLHQTSTKHTNEQAVAGRVSGLIKMGESVTWRAKHLGFYQKLTSKITAFNAPHHFTDEMQKGIFKSISHEHHFIKTTKGTIMTDYFDYESPFGLLGKLMDKVFLKQYMTNFLLLRNATIKEFAESDKWRKILPETKERPFK